MYHFDENFLNFLIQRGFKISSNDISIYGFHIKLIEAGLNDKEILQLFLNFNKIIKNKIIIINQIKSHDFIYDKFIYENFRNYIKKEYFIAKHKIFGIVMIVYTIDQIINNTTSVNKIFYCSFPFYQKILCGIYANNLTKHAIFSREQKADTLYLNGSKVYYNTIFLLISMASLLLIWPLCFWIWYLLNVLLRILQGIFSVFSTTEKIQMKEINWPVYSVLIPMYKEEKIAKQLVQSMINLNYPKHLLDIKILLEENDENTINAIEKIELPYFISVIKIPQSIPQNKPKALNFGFCCVRGEYITIYDAEDIPNADQLKMSVLKFLESGPNVVALQCPLNYYNKNYNFLTKLCSLEYCIWFDFLLRGARKIGGFIPLGGTSNHCKADKIDFLQRWNAFNVTEDIELGAKIVQKKLEVCFLPSHTMEESVISLNSWLKQRTRWMKGYIVTLADYFEEFNCSKTSFLNKINFNNFCFFVILNPLLVSFFIIICIIKHVFSIDIEFHNMFSNICVYISIVTSIFYMLYSYFKMKFSILSSISIGLLFYLYYLMQAIATIRALYQLRKNEDHVWEKTEHGKYLSVNID